MDLHHLEFLTQLLGARVSRADGSAAGEIADVLAQGGGAGDLPRVTAVVIAKGRQEWAAPCSALVSDGDDFKLREGDARYEMTASDLWLKRDVLDKQIVDTQDLRVVRVSDVRLAPASDGSLLVVGVDPGQLAVLRRLLPAGWGDRVGRALGMKDPGFIAWSDVEPTAQSENGVLRLRTTRDGLRQLHPADIADILEQLNPSDRNALLESLPVETAADVVTEADENVQREIMEQLAPEKAADILEEMEPDDAADVVQDLSGSKRKELLEEMEPDDAQDIKELLHYGEDTAGGLMTPEFVALPLHLTAQNAIDRLREIAPTAETIYYIYVVDEEERLSGVISLRDLIVAAPTTPLWNFMVEGDSVVRVSVDDALEEVASQLEHYDLLAVPVVDNQDRLLGIVTVDDTLEELLPDSWRRRRFRRRG